MRILHVCLDYPPRRTQYGSGTVTDDLLAALHRAGHDVTVLTPSRDERSRSPATVTGIRLVETPAELTRRHLLPPDRPSEMFATPRDVQAWNSAAVKSLAAGWPLGHWRPEVVHNDGWTTQPVADALAGWFGCPVVTTAHVVDRHYSTVSGRKRRAEAEFATGEERCFRGSDLIVVPSATARDLAAHYYPEHARRLRVVAHGLDWDAVDRLRSGEAQEASPETITVHYVGRISGERGWRPFLDAFMAAADADRRLRLRVIGGGARLADARQRHAHPSISFLGPMPRPLLLDEIRGGDIVANPALVETFGVAELEAMALGRCLISNTGFGKHTHVEHLVDGVAVPIIHRGGPPALDHDAWAGWLLRLAANARLRRQFGAAARHIARSRYHVDYMAARLVAVFGEAIGNPAPRTVSRNQAEALT